MLSVIISNNLHYPIFLVNLVKRLSDINIIGLMVAGQIILSITVPLSIYLRAHKREPTAHLSFLAGILTLLGSYFFCIYYGILGIGLGFLVSQIIILPFVILIFKKEQTSFQKNHQLNQ